MVTGHTESNKQFLDIFWYVFWSDDIRKVGNGVRSPVKRNNYYNGCYKENYRITCYK